MNRPAHLDAPPHASALLESLRGLGYSTPSALADIVDNSISAGATQVELRFDWGGRDSFITVLDNGHGMEFAELLQAMRLGEKNPLDRRKPKDLGRFGMGLKTASFSQCRRLTVVSRKQAAGQAACLRWDLEHIERHPEDGWALLVGPDPGSGQLLERLPFASTGTLVIWENLDRAVPGNATEQDFLNLIDRVEEHLGMIFHRYLTGPKPKLRLSINGALVAPWDPFLQDHPSTWSSPLAHLAAGTVEVQCHVLPHKDRLDGPRLKQAGGPGGWTAQQGFYVYRNARLLVAGSWLGLGPGRSWTKEEAHRLARIRLDIPNSVDADWKIDIRKSTARPPIALRSELIRLAEDTRHRARRVFAHRGTPLPQSGQALPQAWQAVHGKSGVRYQINPQHPAVKEVLEEAGAMAPRLHALLRILEETVPVQQIWLDTSEARETPRTRFNGQASAEVVEVMSILYRDMIGRKGLTPEAARRQLLSTDPFQEYPELVRGLPDDPFEPEVRAVDPVS